MYATKMHSIVPFSVTQRYTSRYAEPWHSETYGAGVTENV